MKKFTAIAAIILLSIVVSVGVISCKKPSPKIGVSMPAGPAERWAKELAYMKERAQESGAVLTSILHELNGETSQIDQCKQLIDSGIDVLVLTPRDAAAVNDIMEYATKRKVKVISYARVVLGRPVDLFVGYDCVNIGQIMGRHLTEAVVRGNYIILKGDPNDSNAKMIDEGSRKYLTPSIENGNINVLADEFVQNWDAEIAKNVVRNTINANPDKVLNAIFAPNDKLAGACADVLEELGIAMPVVITGMDAELSAAQRIVKDQQAMTVYMDFKIMSHTAIDQAIKMAKGRSPSTNAQYDNGSESLINSYFITGQLVTKQNINKILIDNHVYTYNEIYGID